MLFILEDIEYYVETTKQVLLYKILDMFQYLKISFVFVATCVKVDIVDQFEKRIKSRFSHRIILYYQQSIELFMENLQKVFNEMLWQAGNEGSRAMINQLQAIIMGEGTEEALQEEYDFGK